MGESNRPYRQTLERPTVSCFRVSMYFLRVPRELIPVLVLAVTGDGVAAMPMARGVRNEAGARALLSYYLQLR